MEVENDTDNYQGNDNDCDNHNDNHNPNHNVLGTRSYSSTMNDCSSVDYWTRQATYWKLLSRRHIEYRAYSSDYATLQLIHYTAMLSHSSSKTLETFIRLLGNSRKNGNHTLYNYICHVNQHIELVIWYDKCTTNVRRKH